MKKKIVLMGIGLVLVLTGCGTAGQKTDAQKNEKEKLVIWSYYETDEQQDGLDWLVDNFNMSQDRIEASWEYVPMTDFTKKLAMAYTEESLPDIALLDNPNVSACIQMGMCEDISAFLDDLQIEENYYPVTLEPVTYQGKKYGLPAVCNNVALIYNKKMFADAGLNPPQTWEELEKDAKLLTTDQTKGFLLSAKEGEQGAFQILPWILSTGEEVERIGNEGTQRAFTYLNGFMQDGYMTKNCVNLSQTDVARAFVNGETAMMENGPWILPMLEKSGIDYGISILPVDKEKSVIAGGEDFVVMKGKNCDSAKAFLKYYDQNEIMSKFCGKTSVLPTKKEASIQDKEDMQIFKDQMEYAVSRSSIPHWTNLSDAVPQAFYEMVSEGKNPGRAARELKVDDN